MASPQERVSEAWRIAAEDLGIEVIAPAAVDDEPLLAIVRHFGSAAGTAVVALGDQRAAAASAAAKAAGLFVSTVSVDEYADYRRDLFAETLDDWGWFGPREPPSWYSGAAWGG